MSTVDKFPNDPPPVKAEQLVQILDAISPHPAQFSSDIQFARAGIDPWGRKLHCRVTSTDPRIAEIVIWSDGSNRRDDGGDHDDILVRLVWHTISCTPSGRKLRMAGEPGSGLIDLKTTKRPDPNGTALLNGPKLIA